MIYVGIDPGKNGGLAILQWEEVQTFRYDRDTYRCVLSDLRGEKAVCCLARPPAEVEEGIFRHGGQEHVHRGLQAALLRCEFDPAGLPQGA